MSSIGPDVIGATAETFDLFRCPGCRLVGSIDEDQFHGRVSIDCPECDYHETVNWAERSSAGGQRTQHTKPIG